MSDKKDGGPAFPVPMNALFCEGKPRGLTKREWFAGMAMQSLLRNEANMQKWSETTWQEDILAEMAFGMADAMIDESNK